RRRPPWSARPPRGRHLRARRRTVRGRPPAWRRRPRRRGAPAASEGLRESRSFSDGGRWLAGRQPPRRPFSLLALLLALLVLALALFILALALLVLPLLAAGLALSLFQVLAL